MSGPDAGGSDDRNERPDRRSWDDSGTPGDTEYDPPGETPDQRETSTGSHSRTQSKSSTGGNGVTIADDGLVRWYLKTDDETVVMTRDILSSVAIVAVIGLLLFAVSGIWPPLVAVESGSMEPNMQKGDLIFVVDNERFVGDGSIDDTGVVTLERAQESGHEKFGQPGDVIIFQPDGSQYQTPVIHRAHFWVEEDENWIETKADEDVVGGVTCEQVRHCPADHAGFVTKGDANQGYDQYQGGARTDIVRPEWITGKASLRVPWLGHVRLAFDSLLSSTGPTHAPVLDDPSLASLPLEDTSAAVTVGTAGATGFAGAGAGVAVAIGRRRQ